ncbi:MAG: hypothetical protein ACLFPQ_03665 [Candidatus Woesearchaeota archaeon]
MEDYKRYGKEAKKNIQVADHMLFVTYPLIKDPKLLLAVMENMFLSLTNSMRLLLYHERTYKRVPSFFDTFESKYRVLSEKAALRYGITQETLDFLRHVKNVLVAHKRSPIEFSRRDQFVICSDDYKLEVLGIEEIKDYLKKAKQFNLLAENIVARNEESERN